MTSERLTYAEIGGGSRLVLAHGFTQNAGCWAPFDQLLAERNEVVSVDLPGHGGSGEIETDLWGSALLVGDAGGPATYVGYSLGARTLLHLALAKPSVVSKLVLIGATAGITDDSLRAERRLADEALADELDPTGDSLEGPGTRSASEEARLGAFLERWLKGPLFEGLTPDAAHIEARMRNTCRGLASSLRLCGTGTQQPLWDRLGDLEMPVLVVAGSLDDKFADTGQEMVSAIGGNARLLLIEGAGHACHLQDPRAVAAAIEQFVG